MQSPEFRVRWPLVLQEKISVLRAEKGPAGSSQSARAVRGEIWRILHNALSGYARLHIGRLGPLPEPDLCDLVSEKSLDLLSRLDTGVWNPVEEVEGRVRAYISTVARNGVVDGLRARANLVANSETDGVAGERAPVGPAQEHERPPSDPVEAAEFVECLRGCVASLTPRARRLWFFRVIYEMPSKWIGRHPEVDMKVGAVDVALQRCRETISSCMDGKGMRLRSLPPGTFAALWESCAEERTALAEEEGVG